MACGENYNRIVVRQNMADICCLQLLFEVSASRRYAIAITDLSFHAAWK